MPSRFWIHLRTLVDGQTARTTPINNHLDAIDGGFQSVASEMNRAIRFTANEEFTESKLQLAQTAAQRATRVIGFDAAGNVELRSGTFTWRGNWAGGQSYGVNDMVRAPAANFFSLYVCIVAHTGGTFATDLAAGRWALAVDLSEMNRFIRRFVTITAANSPYAAVAGDDLMVDTGVGAVSVVLPSAPQQTDQPIHIVHVAGTSNITVARNGKLIQGLAEDMTIPAPPGGTGQFMSCELGFCDDARGWRLVKGT